MLTKKATYKIESFAPLNIPTLPDFIVNQHLKIADNILNTTKEEIQHSKDAGLVINLDTEFDLETEIKDHPDSLFVKVFAIKADEMNDNGDYFGFEELKKSTPTFIGVPVFTNHQNTDINQARGKVIHSWWDNGRNGIMIIARVDAEAYPQLARGINENYIAATSMGASRGHDLISMADGSKKRVDEIQINDLILTHKGEIEPVIEIVKTQEHNQLYHIRWNGNKTGLALSFEHPVLVLKRDDIYFKDKSGKQRRYDKQNIQNIEPKFIPASELRSGDYVLELKVQKSPEPVRPKSDSFFFKNYIAHMVKDVILINNSEPTYYLQVGETDDENSDHSYILNDIATHNCQIHHSVCNVCHNYAETPESYCSCVKERKTRNITAKKQKCQYHKHSPKNETCPLCGSTSDDVKTFEVIDKKAFEHNYGIRFIENSFVVNPACHECGIVEVIDPSKLQMKISEIEKRLPNLIKAAETANVLCDSCKCYKIAGQDQLNKLKEALDILTSVSMDMLNQKDQIDLEFLSDLVKVLSDLQGVSDELTQQGYGKLPSPGQQPPTSPTTSAIPAPPETPTAPPTQAGGAGAPIFSGSAGSAGTVTGPMANVLKLRTNMKISSKITNINTNMLNIKLHLHRKLFS